MKIKQYMNYTSFMALLFVALFATVACEDDDNSGDTQLPRLFQPVLNEPLSSIENTIIVDMAALSEAVSYTLEVSRDTFQTVDYVIETDTSFVTINEELVGEELFWNTLYQIRATAHAENSSRDSQTADLGFVRTQRFPSILNVPASYDVTDIAARVTWVQAQQPVTGIQVFSGEDLRLENPLFDERPITEEERSAQELVVEGLEPNTEYQIALYSEDVLRGWVNYTTLPPDVDPNAANVIDIRENESPDAVENAVATAPSGSIILVKRGVTYDLPDDNLTKAITIRAAYGFGEQKAKLVTGGNWDIEDGSTIDHIRFVGLEIEGEDFEGDYVFNPNRSDVTVGTVEFDDCLLRRFRGIMRIRTTTMVDSFKIVNSIVDTIGGYGIFTADTDPGDTPTAAVNHIYLRNSTFNHIDTGIQSRNNSETITIENCTFANFIITGNRFLRYRGGDGNNNVTGGISITNSIFGHSWDTSGEGNYGMRGRAEGLESTSWNIVNVWSTANFSFDDGHEIPGFPVGNYSGTQENLWMNPEENNFNFRDSGFVGGYDSGDPRWRLSF